jgi:hypothetical protein
MFEGICDGKTFYVSYLAERNETRGPAMETVAPGEIRQEGFKLIEANPGLGFTGLPVLARGNSLSLRAGICSAGDPSGDKPWNAADTCQSGPITVVRSR